MGIQELSSPYVKTGGIFYLARMIDKARLNAEGGLPADYVENLGIGFDGRCCNFLHINYEAFRDRVNQGGDNLQILEWAVAHGRKPTDEEVEIWNDFMRKRGWNDEASDRLAFRIREAGFGGRNDILTMFDFIDADEGRPTGGAGLR